MILLNEVVSGWKRVFAGENRKDQVVVLSCLTSRFVCHDGR